MAKNLLHQQLLQTLSEINFSGKYYSHYETNKAETQEIIDDNNYDKKYLKEILDSTNLSFAYQAKERFFTCNKTKLNTIFNLKIAFSSSYIEAIVYIKTPKEIAGPFSLLARESAQIVDPDFLYSPSSPKIPFRNPASLAAGVKHIVALFEEILDNFSPYD